MAEDFFFTRAAIYWISNECYNNPPSNDNSREEALKGEEGNWKTQ